MDKRLFVDINVIQTMPPNCANRDDTGSPKTCIYGGVRRARVSSQSWKRAVREYFHGRVDEEELSVRTMKIVQMVADRIQLKDPSVSEEDAVKKAVDVISAAGVKVKEKKKKGSEGDEVPEAQALFFMSNKQAQNMADLALAGGYDKKAAQAALNKGHGIDTALFGRMVADDPQLNADASAQVAHAISTHRVDNEYDYFTAVDEKAPEDNAGAGMIGTVEFNSSTLYRYATVAVHDLARQLDDKDVVATAVEEFVRAFVLSMPTGKQNTFANRSVPYAVYIAVRGDQPVSLAPAFETPVQPDRSSGGYNPGSVAALVSCEMEYRKDFIGEPIATWQVGNGLEGLGPASDLNTALDELKAEISGELRDADPAAEAVRADAGLGHGQQDRYPQNRWASEQERGHRNGGGSHGTLTRRSDRRPQRIEVRCQDGSGRHAREGLSHGAPSRRQEARLHHEQVLPGGCTLRCGTGG